MIRTETVFTAGERMTPEIAVTLAQQAEKFAANLVIGYDNTTIQLDSLIGVLSLELYRGKTLFVIADGADENEAAETICKVLSAK